MAVAVSERVPSTASTSDSVLVIVAAQNEYAHGHLKVSNLEASRFALANLVNKYRSAGAPIIHALHRSATGSPIFTPLSGLIEEFSEVKAIPGEQVVIKQYPGAFTNTDLDKYLKASGKTKIVLAGYLAHVCISTTARQASEKGYDVIVAREAVGDREIPGAKAEELVRMVLLELGDAFGTVVKVEDIN